MKYLGALAVEDEKERLDHLINHLSPEYKKYFVLSIISHCCKHVVLDFSSTKEDIEKLNSEVMD